MSMQLKRFKVHNYRSIEESDWIEIAHNSCLIGTNESGKTNLLLALWKLRPANQEPIVPLDDFPRHLYSNYTAGNYSGSVFIEADFDLDNRLRTKIAGELNCNPEQLKTVLIKRLYNGNYNITFPYSKLISCPSEQLIEIVSNFKESLLKFDSFVTEKENLKNRIIEILDEILDENKPGSTIVKDDVNKIISSINELEKYEFGKRVNLPEFFESKLKCHLSKLIDGFDGKPVETTDEVRQNVLKSMPKFVYYSDYGNLNSEIFLPRVIEDFEREDLTESARAKARTLDVLFRFVNLSPQEIYELGNDRKVVIKKIGPNNQLISEKEEDLTEEEVAEWADKKRERGILLQSAASQLTISFNEWWLQGNYIFAFDVDGNHFRINVSDTLRPEKIELEGRSRGLQWFFSFFLVFLVETDDEHSNTILLLDEPGLSLHPIAQYDLAKFFRKLSVDNQLIYTSHSPFLVDMENLANVKAVYIDTESGRTKVSSNLRYNEADSEKSIYPVHAALGLTVSDTLLLGCLPILVEGPSDQIYLTMIKRYLMGLGSIKNSREIVFIPTGGVKGMGPVSKLVSSREDDLPYVLLDSDKKGKEFATQLKNGRYREQKEKVLEIKDYLGEKEYEIEDLLPNASFIKTIDRFFRFEKYFEDFYDDQKPIVDQIETWAKENEIPLIEGWKVDLSRSYHNHYEKNMDSIEDELKEIWEKLFNSFLK